MTLRELAARLMETPEREYTAELQHIADLATATADEFDKLRAEMGAVARPAQQPDPAQHPNPLCPFAELECLCPEDRPRDIWTLAEAASAEVATWPAWKRRAADTALVSKPESARESEPVAAGRLSIREAARRRVPLGGPDAQALEGALAITERERDEAQRAIAEAVAELRSRLEETEKRRRAARLIPFDTECETSIRRALAALERVKP